MLEVEHDRHSVGLPVAIVGDFSGALTEIRVYHSMWPLLGRHKLRPPLLPGEQATSNCPSGGGIPLEHCSATYDGVCCAIEYNAVSWGRFPLPAQAGVAVYQKGESGLLCAARIYDDVDPPLSSTI